MSDKRFSLKDFFGGGVAEVVEKIGEAVNKNVTSKEEREKLRIELTKLIGDLQLDIEKIKLEDRVSSRELQALAITAGDKKAKNFLSKFSWFWSISSFIYFAAITWKAPADASIANTILGFLLGTAVAAILNFHYGSSAGSSNKSEIIEQVLNKK